MRRETSASAMQVCAAIIAGLGAMLAAPWVPLRVTAACAALLLAGLVLVRRLAQEFRILWLFYGWFSLSTLATVSMCYSGDAAGISIALVALGQALAVAATVRMPKSNTSTPSILGHGLILGCLSIMIFAFFLQWIVRATGFVMDLKPMALLLTLAAGAFFAARGARADISPRPMNSAMCIALTLPVLAAIFMFGLWLTARTNTEYHLQYGNTEEAARWNKGERDAANLLGVPSWRAAAFLRGATIYKKNPLFYPVFLRHALDAEPLNREANLRMLVIALRGNDYDTAMRCFNRLPVASLSPAVAWEMLPALATRIDWPAFFRAWRLAAPLREKKRLPALIDWNRAMIAAYHRGEYGIVSEIAAVCEPSATNAWAMRRTRVLALLRSGQAGKSRAELIEPCAGRIPAEYAYLKALTYLKSGGQTAPGDAAQLMQQVLELYPSHYGAKRWLARRGVSFPGEPLLATPGVAFPDKLRLVDCATKPLRVAPGSEISVTAWWEILGPVDPSWKVFLHVRQNVHDGFYFQGDYPFSEVIGGKSWMIGELFEYEKRVAVPSKAPAGTYRIVIGLWDRVDMFDPVAEDRNWTSLRPIANHRILLDALVEIAPAR